LKALALSPLPDRLPLEVRTGGRLERNGYTLECVYWQTWPKVWSSGWLYRPEGLSGKAPAILNPHGHWDNGARHPVVQSRCIALAKLGYVALAVDSIHHYDYPVGVSPLTVMTYNNLRTLDLLQSLPEVDRERIGATGASGGAQQLMSLLAVDDRVRCAVLAVMVTYFKRIMSAEEHHCPCNHVPGMMRVSDELELCGVAAPRPLLFLTVEGDWTSPFPEHELRELRALYRLWQQPDRLAHRQFAGPHDYSRPMREAAYLWFERELRGNRVVNAVSEPELTVEPPESLLQLASPPEEDRGLAGIRQWYAKRFVAQPPQLESRKERKNYQERVRGELLELLGGPVTPVTLETIRHEDAGDVQRVSFRSEREVRLPALWLPAGLYASTDRRGASPVAITLHPEGKDRALRGPMTTALQAAGYSIRAPDLRFCGELQREWLYNCLLWGRPEAGMAAHDLSTCVDWIWEQEGVEARRLVVIAEGDLGITALLAAGQDERITCVIADCCGTTYRDGGQGLPVVPNILRVADVPQIASIMAPRPVWLFNVPGERVGFSSRRYYDWTRRTYQSLGEDAALRMSVDERPPAQELAAWLESRLNRALR
jgi:hypothetical protein